MAADTKGVLDADISRPGMGGVEAVHTSGVDTLGQGMAARTASTQVLAEGELIPVVRETIQVSKREVETGRATVRKTVSEREEAVEMLLRHTDVSVERVPVNRVVTEAPASRQEGDVLIIPVLEEVLVVEKRLMLKEEIRIRTTSGEKQVHEMVRLRSEDVHIEQSGNVSVPPASPKQES